MEYTIEMKQVESQTTAVVRRRCSLNELATVVPQACGEVWAFVRSSGLPRPGRHLAVYLDDEMNIEVGVEIDQPFPDSDSVVCSCTPAGLVATTAHFGPYHRLGEAHEAIHRWCEANGRTPVRPCWEVYGHWIDEYDRDPGKIRTDVFYLLVGGRT